MTKPRRGQLGAGGVAVGQGAALAAGYDGGEGHGFGPGDAGGVFQFGGDGGLGHAGLDDAEDVFEESAAERGSGAHLCDLVGILDPAQFGDQGADGREELAAQGCGDCLAHLVERGDGGVAFVEAAACDVGGGEPLAGGEHGGFGRDDDASARGFGFGLRGVAAIGEEDGAAADERQGRRSNR